MGFDPEKMGNPEAGEKNEGEEKVVELDFDMLCTTVALRAEGGFYGKENWGELEGGLEFGGGVQRMWEGEILDCFEDRKIALETACCPCYTFGKNMRRAGLGSCFIQGAIYLILFVATAVNYITYAINHQRGFLYLAILLTIFTGTYLGFFRRQIRKQFNIGGSENSLDNCLNHLICPCCTLCQESRTLEINNVQDGVWRGRGDTICIGSYGKGSKGFVELRQPPLIQIKYPDPCSTQRALVGTDHSWSVDATHSDPLVPSTKL